MELLQYSEWLKWFPLYMAHMIIILLASNGNMTIIETLKFRTD